MTKKEYLNQVFYITKLIENKMKRLETLNALTQKGGATLSHMPKGGTPDTKSKVEDVTASAIDLRDEIEEQIETLKGVISDITKVIENVSDYQERYLLELRYLNFFSWEDIQDTLLSSTTQVFRIHRSALSHIQIPNNI